MDSGLKMSKSQLLLFQNSLATSGDIAGNVQGDLHLKGSQGKYQHWMWQQNVDHTKSTFGGCTSFQGCTWSTLVSQMLNYTVIANGNFGQSHSVRIRKV